MNVVAQDGHIKFMGIELNGTVTDFQSKLQAKGLTLSSVSSESPSGIRVFDGVFSGEDAQIVVWYNPRSKQVYLGRVDPITKEIRPKGKNGKRNRYQASAQVDALREELAADKQAIKEAKEKIASLEGKVNRAGKFYVEMKDLITQYEDSLGSEGTGGESI